MPSIPFVLPFAQCTADIQQHVGSKCASLGVLTALGARVPPGFAITTAAYNTAVDTGSTRSQIHGWLEQLAVDDVTSADFTGRKIRALIEQSPLPAPLETAIRSAYDDLCGLTGLADPPVAVRSSATVEDLPEASFAGQQDTWLWIVGADAVIEYVRKCWASLFTARAIVYRHDRGFDHQQVKMAVAVQKMVNARTAGVAMTLNPVNGDRSKIAIDASWGLGQVVVGGEVTPDNFLVDKIVFEIVERTISTKLVEVVPDAARRTVVQRAVECQRQDAPSLSSDEVIAIARMARHLEKEHGSPQDIEWAIDADLPAGSNLMILQCRPETVWSQKKTATPRSRSRQTGIAGVLETLLGQVER